MLKKIIILLLLGSWTSTFAQEPLRFTTKQGLPTNHVYDIAEDKNGFMWFATKQGLVKFDGENFKTFTIQDGLPNNDTWLLELDNQGRLWFFSKSAYQGYIKNDSIYTISRKDKKVLSPRFLYKSIDDLRFHSTLGSHLLNEKEIIADDYYNFDNLERLNKEFANIQKSNGFEGDYLMPIIYNPKSNYYTFLQEKKALVYNQDFKLIKEIPLNIPLEYEVSKRKIDNQGLLYNNIGFFATAYGILFIDYATYKLHYKSFKELVGVEKINYFRCFNTENNIQISIPEHLIIFDYNLNVLETHKLPKKLSSKSFKDSKGNIWMADLAYGISLFPNAQITSQYYLQNNKVQKINCIDDKFFVGINDKGFFQLDKKDFNTSKQLSFFTRGNGEIYQIKEDAISKVNYFIAANKLYQWNNKQLKNLTFKNIPYTGHSNAGTKDITFFNQKNYIVSSDYLYTSDTVFEKLEIIVHKIGLLFTEVFNKQLFVAGSDGLWVLHNKTLSKLFNNNLQSVPVSSLLSTKNYLFVGTDGRGIYVVDTKKKIHFFKETEGLSIQRIIAKENTVWLATQKGVFVVQINSKNLEQSKIINAFYDTDGLLQNNTNDIYLENNKIYAASDVGLSVLKIDNPIYKQQPNLYFKTQSDTLYYKNKERENIAISFSTLNFINQEHLKYRYRLLPLNKNWVETTTQILNFSNLAPNIYTLEVELTDQHNNKNIKKQFLNVVPKWWETIWAKIAFSLMAILFFIGLIFLIKRQIKKQEEAKTIQNKRIAGLELQALRSQMNPHFVHNSLNAIQYFIQRNEVELSENYLSKFSQLIRLFFEYSRRQTVTIQEELNLLKNYLEIEKLRFEEKLNYSISVCDSFDKDEQLIPSMLLQPIVENAVNHGLFHKKENGNIRIVFEYINNETFKVIIDDDGIGINKSKKLFKTSSKNYQSSSSKVLQERLELLNQSDEWKISFKIQDKSDIENSLKGTLVTLIFKQLN